MPLAAAAVVAAALAASATFDLTMVNSHQAEIPLTTKRAPSTKQIARIATEAPLRPAGAAAVGPGLAGDAAGDFAPASWILWPQAGQAITWPASAGVMASGDWQDGQGSTELIETSLAANYPTTSVVTWQFKTVYASFRSRIRRFGGVPPARRGRRG